MIKNFFIPYNNKKVIKGTLHSKNNSNILIILCHGLNDSKENPNIKRISKLLNKKFNIFRFTFTDNKDIYLPEEKINIDIIVDYFSKKYKKIILLGASLGGLSAILGAINNKKIYGLVLINPFIFFHHKVAWNFKKTIIKMFLSYPFIKKVRDNLNFYFKNFKPKSINVPTLIITGKYDKEVSFTHGKKLFEIINNSNKKFILDKKIDHGLTKDVYKKIVVKYIINWLKNV